MGKAKDLEKIAGRTSPGVVIAICFLIAGLEGYDIQAFGVAAPRLVHEFGLVPSQQGWVASIAMVGLVVGAMIGGWLADRIGRKPVLLAAVLCFGACSIWTAYSPDYPILLLARLATGLGFGGAMPNLIAIAAEITPPKRRGVVTSAMFCGMPAGGTAVALVARLSPEHSDWRLLFLIGGILPLVLVPLVQTLLPETRPARDPALDHRTMSALFGSGRAASTLLLWLANLLTLVILYLMLNWLPTLVVAQGHTPNDGAAASVAFNLVAVIGALLLGQTVDQVGFRWPMLAAYALLGAVMAALGAAHIMGAILALSGAAGFLVVGGLFALYGFAPAIYPAQVRAIGAGAAVGVGRLGSVIGPIVGGQLRQAGWPAQKVLLAMLPVALTAGAVILLLTVLVEARTRRLH